MNFGILAFFFAICFFSAASGSNDKVDDLKAAFVIKNKILLARADAKYKDILSRLGQLSKQQTEHFDTSTTSSTTRILNSIKTTLDPWKKTTSASTVLALNKLSETVGVLVSILDEINTEGTRILVQGVTDLETDIKNGDNIINNFYTTFFPEEFAARVTTATLLPDSAKVKVCKRKYFRDSTTYTNTLVAELENSFMTFYNGNKNLERVILKGLDNITDTAIAGINTINNCKKSNKIFSVHDLDVATTPAKETFNDCLAWSLGEYVTSYLTQLGVEVTASYIATTAAYRSALSITYDTGKNTRLTLSYAAFDCVTIYNP